MTPSLRALLRRLAPGFLKARLPGRLKARLRAALGIEPWPDLAVRHPLFRNAQYRTLRREARAFDVEKPHKPVLERGHQTSYLVARWFAEAGVKSAFHVGYASGRYLFYLSRMGVRVGGTDLPASETAWTQVAASALDERIRRRLLDVDFFDLTPELIRSVWTEADLPLGVLFSEATFETMLPWREAGVSVVKYGAMERARLHRLMQERFPETLCGLTDCFRNMVFIEPEPSAGGAGAVFSRCAGRLAGLAFSVWRFHPPFDSLFRLSVQSPVRQAVYAYTRDQRLLDTLRPYADPL